VGLRTRSERGLLRHRRAELEQLHRLPAGIHLYRPERIKNKNKSNQHQTPADEAAYGDQCLDFFLRAPDGTPLRPDLLYFNWSIHSRFGPNDAVSAGGGGWGNGKQELKCADEECLHLLFLFLTKSGWSRALPIRFICSLFMFIYRLIRVAC
jgi:hypothetical protein